MREKKRCLDPERQERVDFLKSFPGLRVSFIDGTPDKNSPFYDLWAEQNRKK